MSTSEKIKALLAAMNISVNEAARRMGTTRQNLSHKMKTGKWYVDDLERIAEAVGAEVQITFAVPARRI
ncbi:MAG: XRE family transcriptional regulator [Clostridia bacterium]|nr:XRE family transcriptional regulator [Clostridia bacterium]